MKKNKNLIKIADTSFKNYAEIEAGKLVPDYFFSKKSFILGKSKCLQCQLDFAIVR